MFLWFISYLVYGVLLQQPKWNKTGVLAKLRVSEEVTFNLRFERVGLLGGSVVKNLPASEGDARDVGLISGSGRCPGEGSGSPLQYSCLGNPMDRGAWQAAIHGVTKSQTQLSD